MFVPGAVKYLDVPGLLSLNAPGKLWVAGEGAGLDALKGAFTAGGQAGALVAAPQGADAGAAVGWIVQP